MSGLVASAPGKVFLCGEYAVLEGAPAVLAAVDRRAIAREAKAAPRPSPVIAAVLEEAGARCAISVRTPGFTRGRAKLGLGSSAAVAVAASALVLARARGGPDVPGDAVFGLALAAHGRAQGGRGSGADVAASVHGGAIRYRKGAAVEALPPCPAALAFAWTGRSASTTELVARVREFVSRSPAEGAALLGELAACASELAAAHAALRVEEIVRLTAAYGAAMGRLGEASGAPIVTDAHARVAGLAKAHGGAGKPSGAGGGDLAMAVFEDPADRDRFASALREEGIVVVDLRLGGPGVEIARR